MADSSEYLKIIYRERIPCAKVSIYIYISRPATWSRGICLLEEGTRQKFLAIKEIHVCRTNIDKLVREVKENPKNKGSKGF